MLDSVACDSVHLEPRDDHNMAISIRCPECRKGYRLRAESVGRRVTCKQCGTSFLVEAARPTQPPVEHRRDVERPAESSSAAPPESRRFPLSWWNIVSVSAAMLLAAPCLFRGVGEWGMIATLGLVLMEVGVIVGLVNFLVLIVMVIRHNPTNLIPIISLGIIGTAVYRDQEIDVPGAKEATWGWVLGMVAVVAGALLILGNATS